MADYLDKIEEGLAIAQPEIVLPWNLKKSNVFDELDGVNIVNENYYTLGIILDGLPFINCAGLHFDEEKLSEIELFDNEKRCVKAKADDVFDAHQILLESFFGTPCRNRLSEKIRDVDKEYRWRFKRVTIIHKLWDRFGLEEKLTIRIKS